jgi:hypothetical protein
MILVDQTKIKLLYTKKFHHGDYTQLETAEFQQDFKIHIKKVTEMTLYSEVYSGQNEVKGVRRQLIEIDADRL